MKNSILTFVILFFVQLSFAQELGFGIMPESRTIKKENVSVVKVITDIHPQFPTSWIREYIEVSLTLKSEDETLTAKGSDFAFNEEQRRILKLGETGGAIKVVVQYYPDNNLTKEVKELDFSFGIVPDQDSEFPGGEEPMLKYLKENVIDRLPEMSIKDFHHAKVSFTVTSNGKVVNAMLTQNSGIAQANELLIATIEDMPKWTPAQNADGTNHNQNFEFIVTRDYCTNPTLFAN